MYYFIWVHFLSNNGSRSGFRHPQLRVARHSQPVQVAVRVYGVTHARGQAHGHAHAPGQVRPGQGVLPVLLQGVQDSARGVPGARRAVAPKSRCEIRRREGGH